MLRNSPLKPGIALNVALSAFLLWVLVMVGNYALNRPVSFDGAMNLQVAQSLSDGEGYVRHYGGTRAFPIEVQTDAPFIVPAAAVFKLFGVGMVQSQLVNFAYMALFLLLVGYVLARFFGTGIALAGALACFLVPGFYQIGMNGWGELVAFLVVCRHVSAAGRFWRTVRHAADDPRGAVPWTRIGDQDDPADRARRNPGRFWPVAVVFESAGAGDRRAPRRFGAGRPDAADPRHRSMALDWLGGHVGVRRVVGQPGGCHPVAGRRDFGQHRGRRCGKSIGSFHGARRPPRFAGLGCCHMALPADSCFRLCLG